MFACLGNNTCLLVQQDDCPRGWQENTSWRCARLHAFLLDNTTCLLVVFLLDKNPCLLVQQETMSSCSTRGPIFLFNNKTCLPVQKEDVSSSLARSLVFLFNMRIVFLFNKENYPTCWTIGSVFLKINRFGSHSGVISRSADAGHGIYMQLQRESDLCVPSAPMYNVHMLYLCESDAASQVTHGSLVKPELHMPDWVLDGA